MGREYNEVIEVLKHIPKEDYNKIPKNMIDMFKANIEPNYYFEFDTKKTLDEQNVSKDARTIIAILFRDYWATEEQRKRIIEKENYDKQKIEEEKREKYQFSFEDRKQKIKEKNMYMTEIKEEKWYKKIINKILNFFRIRE